MKLAAFLPSYSVISSSFDSSETKVCTISGCRRKLSLPRKYTAAWLPPIAVSTSQHEFYGVSAPSGEMGGDLVDLVQDGDKWIGYLADVSGHGVPSGVLMAMVKSAVRMRLATSSEPQVLLEDLNRVISELTAAEMFVTLAFVSLGKSNDLHFTTA